MNVRSRQLHSRRQIIHSEPWLLFITYSTTPQRKGFTIGFCEDMVIVGSRNYTQPAIHSKPTLTRYLFSNVLALYFIKANKIRIHCGWNCNTFCISYYFISRMIQHDTWVIILFLKWKWHFTFHNTNIIISSNTAMLTNIFSFNPLNRAGLIGFHIWTG